MRVLARRSKPLPDMTDEVITRRVEEAERTFALLDAEDPATVVRAGRAEENVRRMRESQRVVQAGRAELAARRQSDAVEQMPLRRAFRDSVDARDVGAEGTGASRRSVAPRPELGHRELQGINLDPVYVEQTPAATRIRLGECARRSSALAAFRMARTSGYEGVQVRLAPTPSVGSSRVRSRRSGGRRGRRRCSPVRNHDPSSPTWSAPSRWRMYRLGVKAAAGDQPGGQRVGVPHLSRLALVASPDESRHGGYQVKDALRE